MKRFFRRGEPAPPPGATADEAATRPMEAVREDEKILVPRRRPPRFWPWLALLVLLVLAGLVAAFFLTRGDDDGSGARSVTVPDVVGERVDQAIRQLGMDGLTAQVARASSERPRGEVLRERPPAGTTLARGGRVTLVVSSGKEKVEVPDVIGLPLAQAFRRLEAAGLRPIAKRTTSPRPRGRVVGQRPKAGAKLEREQTVVLSVSKGPARVAVPDVVGLSEAEASAKLTTVGLRANVARVASPQATGTVVAQNPVAGTRAARGSAVRINVSKGAVSATAPPSATRTTTTTTTNAATTTTPTTTAPTTTTATATATVPDVVGLDEAAARARLRQVGLTVRTITRTTTNPAEDGVVLEQRPAAGASAQPGAQVTITIGVLA